LFSLSKQQLTILGLASSLYFILVIVRVNTTSLMWRYLILGSVFIIAAIIDLFTYTLPDILTLGGALLGFLLPGNDVISSIKGSLAGLVIMSFIAAVSRGGMGGGDVKLALTMGSFLGWPLVLPALGLSFLLGGSFGLILLMTKVKDRTDSIPFGPFLTLGTLIVSLWGQELIQWYLTSIWRQP